MLADIDEQKKKKKTAKDLWLIWSFGDQVLNFLLDILKLLHFKFLFLAFYVCYKVILNNCTIHTYKKSSYHITQLQWIHYYKNLMRKEIRIQK